MTEKKRGASKASGPRQQRVELEPLDLKKLKLDARARADLRLLAREGPPVEAEADCCEKHAQDPITIRRLPTPSWSYYLVEAAHTCGIKTVWIAIVERLGVLKGGGVVAQGRANGNCPKKLKTDTFFQRQRGKKYYVLVGATNCCNRSVTFFYPI